MSQLLGLRLHTGVGPILPWLTSQPSKAAVLLMFVCLPLSRHFPCCKTWWIKNLNLNLNRYCRVKYPTPPPLLPHTYRLPPCLPNNRTGKFSMCSMCIHVHWNKSKERWLYVKHCLLFHADIDCSLGKLITFVWQSLYFIYFNKIMFEDVPLVKFMYLVFTRMPGKSYRRRLRS